MLRRYVLPFVLLVVLFATFTSVQAQSEDWFDKGCSYLHAGPGGILPGRYDPATLTQEQRQWLHQLFGHTGAAPSSYGGEDCYARPEVTIPPAKPLPVTDNDCPDATSRLRVGDKAKVSDYDQNPLKVSSYPNVADLRNFFVPTEEVVTLIAGPVCNQERLWWEIDYMGQTGWAREINPNDTYNLLPLSPSEAAIANPPPPTAAPAVPTPYVATPASSPPAQADVCSQFTGLRWLWCKIFGS